ncbi:transmembrane emp24 domain-containing protein [Anaeramoeba ignava]|uniref:Transmembrane emp24 domain-containing protein n=1 Tax=Anaeramoeba ignava TaxID=1746090 RepID=A0A9Q0LUE1_ANAIG|nr:transmembrane emp24 domain-containing protein [Anaeramoeba ignava]
MKINFFCLLFLIFLFVNSLKFNFGDTTTKCFYEELDPKSLVKGSFERKSGFFAFDFIVYDPRNEIMKIFLLFLNSKGHTYHHTESALITINFIYSYSHSTQISEKDLNLETFSLVEKEMIKIDHLLAEISQSMVYMKYREETMRNTNESTNSRVLWFSLLTIFTLLSLAVFQIRYLKYFFKLAKIN